MFNNYHRGKYVRSQEWEQYEHRRRQDERMRSKFIGDDGVLLFGAHKGRHYTKVPSPYIEWAKLNIEGFAQRLSLLTPMRPSGASPTPRGHIIPERASKEATGPSEAQERAWRANDVDAFPRLDPDDAVDWEDDPGIGAFFEQG